MPYPKPSSLSESEEMYLVTIAKLIENGKPAPISLSELAHEMDIQPVSVNQMIRKLAEQKLLIYTPYHGVELDEAGKEIATRIIRYRRLWEVFLVNNLEVPISEAEELACRLEHITPASISDRLCEFLGNPKTDPRGNSIPSVEQKSIEHGLLSLSQAVIHQSAKIVQIKADPSIRSFLLQEGLSSGTIIHILAKGNNGNILIQAGENMISLARKLTEMIDIDLVDVSI